jgi:hypothetical protein
VTPGPATFPRRTKTPVRKTSEEEDIEEAKEDVHNLSDLETPRVDVTGLKLDTAHKEKTFFLQELRKQSFLLSEDSTQKVDVKDSVNVSAI